MTILGQSVCHQVQFAGSHGQDQVTRLRQLAQPCFQLAQGGIEFCAGNLGGQVFGGNASGIDLSRRIDLRQQHQIRCLQLLNELVKQGDGTAVGVGLEGADDPLVAQTLGHLEQHMDLTRVMGVVVIDLGAVDLPFVLKPPLRSAVGG